MIQPADNPKVYTVIAQCWLRTLVRVHDNLEGALVEADDLARSFDEDYEQATICEKHDPDGKYKFYAHFGFLRNVAVMEAPVLRREQAKGD